MKEEKTIDKNLTALIVEAARKYAPNTTFISHFGKKCLVTEDSEIVIKKYTDKTAKKYSGLTNVTYDIYINGLLVYYEGQWANVINN